MLNWIIFFGAAVASLVGIAKAPKLFYLREETKHSVSRQQARRMLYPIIIYGALGIGGMLVVGGMSEYMK